MPKFSGGMVQMYRFFDLEGKPGVRPYKRVRSRLTKADATKMANTARRKGYKARVVKEADGWVVFVHPVKDRK